MALTLLLASRSSAATIGGHEWHPEVPPAPVTFLPEDTDPLKAGDVVFHYFNLDSARVSGFAATLTSATPEAVWREILDVDTYVRFLPYVTSSRVVERQNPQGSRRILCELELTTLGVVTRFDMDNFWFEDFHYLTWAIFSKGKTPGIAATGTWRVEPWAPDPSRTLITYQADVDVNWWIPGFLRQRAADRGLPTVVRLIRHRAEEHDATPR